MARFLIEVPHEAEKVACARAIPILLTTGCWDFCEYEAFSVCVFTIFWWYPHEWRILSISASSIKVNAPIIDADTVNMKSIIDIVDQILLMKKSDPKSDTGSLEAAIDRLVYDLYGLTEEEIAIVQESMK